MQEISITITQDQLYEFFVNFDTLSRKQKELWKLIVWWAKKFPNAHPCQLRLAHQIGCTREHVNRTLAKFKKWGWLSLNDRGRRQTKTLGIPANLLATDVVNRQYFKRLEITSEITHSYSSYRTLTSKPKGEILTVPLSVQKFNFSLQDGLKMALVPESVRQEALRTARKLGAQGWRPNNQGAYVAGIALNMAEKQGHKLDWKSYYRTLNR